MNQSNDANWARCINGTMIGFVLLVSAANTNAQDCNLNGVADDLDVIPTFSQQILPYHESTPEQAIAADINGDGLPDVIVSSDNNNSVYRMINLGASIFTPPDLVASNILNPYRMRTGDMDGDGDVDLVVCDLGGGDILWFANDGTGTFAPEQVVTTVANPSSCYLADLDGDGDLDVLDTSRNDQTLGWTENSNGLGAFGPRQVIYTGLDYPGGAYATDLDGDGDLDVMAAGEVNNLALWFENTDGAGTFAAPHTISTVAAGPIAITAEDLDADGDLDLILGSSGDNTVAWLENTDGLGSFGPRNILSITHFGLNDVATADMDADGMADVIVSAFAGDKVIWYRRMDDTPTFSAPHQIASAPFRAMLSLVDFDANGTLDFLTPRDANARTAWYASTLHDCNTNQIPDDCELAGNDCNLNGVPDDCEPADDCNNNGVTDICELSGNDCNNNSVPDECELSGNDCNSDGILDACQQDCNDNGIPDDCEALVDCNANGIQDSCDALINDCDGNGIPDDCDDDCDADGQPDRCQIRPSFDAILVSPSASNPRRVASGDLDGDGDDDVLIGSITQTKIYWRQNNGTGGFGGKLNITVQVQGITDVKVADIDADGDLDVLSTSSNDFKLAWYENVDGNGTYSSQQVIDIVYRPQSVFAADLDGDSDLDVLTATSQDDEILWYENTDGQGTFGPKQTITNMAEQASCVIAGDFDGDGDNDVAYASQSDNTVAWRENLDGLGDFSGPERLISVQALGVIRVAAADLDSDGDLDIVSGTQFDSKIAWYENTDGLGTYGAPRLISSTINPWQIRIGDLDTDGDNDIAAVSLSDNTVCWFENLDGIGGFDQIRVIGTGPSQPQDIEISDVDGDGRADLHVVSSGDNSQWWYRNTSNDCNANLILDACELAGQDCDADGVLDACEIDCNANGTPDDCETGPDCNANSVPDDCEPDCDNDGVPDECELSGNDCDANGTPDDCQPDCDNDGIPDTCELQGNDCDSNGIPDDCQADCDNDGIPDVCAIVGNDCNQNGVPDDCDVDCNANGVPDDCETGAIDCNGNGVPDECEPANDCDGNGVTDICDTFVAFTPRDLTTGLIASVRVRRADIDGDGDIDILATSGSMGIHWYENSDGAGTLASPSTIAAALGSIHDLVAFDIDGDSRLDLVVAYADLNQIDWHRNLDGHGTFGPANTVTDIAFGVTSLAIADFDGDGDNDIAYGSESNDNIGLCLNDDGRGSFGQPIVVSTEVRARILVSPVDIDGDNDMDLLATSGLSDSVYWFENTDGNATFGPRQFVGVNLGSDPQFVYGVDLDSDGDQDVLTVTWTDGHVYWMENLDGLGAFATPLSLIGNLGTLNQTEPADLNGDGLVDVIYTHAHGDINWLQNRGMGVFDAPRVISPVGSDIFRYSFAADFDGDGDVDVVASATTQDQITLFENTRDDCNNNMVPDSCELSGNDCNANGIPDECDEDCNQNQIPDVCEPGYIDCNNNGVFDACETLEDCNDNGTPDLCEIADLSAADCNNNGRPDECDLTDNDCNANGVPDDCEPDTDCDANGIRDLCEIEAADCNANGVFDACETAVGFVAMSMGTTENEGDEIELLSADLDSDGDADLIASFDNNRSLVIYVNQLDGSGIVELQRINTNNVDGLVAIAAGDIDGDHDVDIAAVSSSADLLLWYENLASDGVMGSHTVIAPINNARYVALTDIDGDGDSDIVAIGRDGGEHVIWFENTDGHGAFGPRRLIAPTNYGEALWPADIDGDGDIDIVGEFNNTRMTWCRNIDGLGTFSSPILVSNSVANTAAIRTADLDSDGDQDIFFASRSTDEFSWFENVDGAGTFGPIRTILVNAPHADDIHAVDLDGDGDLDLVGTVRQENKVVWFENTNGTGAFSEPHLIAADAILVRDIVVADFDSDGDADVLSGSNTNETLKWYQNQSNDCNGNQIPDECEIGEEDCNGNGILDGCESQADCNGNQIQDICELENNDCNMNQIPDDCESDQDCNANGILDLCELDGNDCNGNRIPDDCESQLDCNANGVLDFCELENNDCDANGIPDDCEPDCDADGVIDACETIVAFEEIETVAVFTTLALMDVGDMNGDAYVDIVAADLFQGRIVWYPYLETGVYDDEVVISASGTPSTVLKVIDLDGDGDMDIVESVSSTRTIYWHENVDGMANFAPPAIVASGHFGRDFVEFADLNSDGLLDVLSDSDLPGIGVVWIPSLGGSPVSFDVPRVAFWTASEVDDVATPDVDGDGIPDLVAACDSSEGLVWLRHVDGAGVFALPQQIMDTATHRVEAEDIDNDGWEDLVAASAATLQITYHRNTDTPQRFEPAVVINGSYDAEFLSLVDVSGDGHPDVVTGSYGTGTSGWIENVSGAGDFNPYTVVAPSGHLIATDIDRDGVGDLIHVSDFPARLYRLQSTSNDCNGNRIPDNCESLEADCDQDGIPDLCEAAGNDCDNDGVPDSCELSGNDCNDNDVPDNCEPMDDCNNNGIPDICDIATGSPDCNNNAVIDTCELSGSDADMNGIPDECEPSIGDCNVNGISDSIDTEPHFLPQLVDADIQNPFHVVVADLNGDYRPDILSTSASNPKVRWYPNIGGSTQFGAPIPLASTTLSATALLAIDIDLDGDTDVVAGFQASPTMDRISLYENLDGLGTFGNVQVISNRATDVSSLAAADLDNDGDLDIIAALADRVTWYENLTGSFAPEQLVHMGGAALGRIAAADLDGDLDLDVVSAEVNGVLGWHENLDGNGTFAPRHLIATGNPKTDLALVDIDVDGDIDIIASAGNMPFVEWYENLDGMAAFGERNIIGNDGGWVYGIEVIDLDFDGDLDILSASFEGDTVGWYENLTGTPTFSPLRIFETPSTELREVRAADFDGDGDLDLVTVSTGDDRVLWYENFAGDCNGNSVPDSCELAGNDCNANGIPDDCESPADCDMNGVPDICDIANGAVDCDGNGVPDDCELPERDCNANSIVDICEVIAGTVEDCDTNGRPDSCDAVEPDCNANGRVDTCETDDGSALDCNNNQVPDECELSGNDCNMNGIPDDCDVLESDCNSNGIPDDCELFENDCNANGVPDECDAQTIFAQSQVATPRLDRATWIAAGDIDEDGEIDLVATSNRTDEVVWLPNTDRFDTPVEPLVIDNGCINPTSVAIADIDGDGHSDVVAACADSPAVNWYANLDGTGVFGGPMLISGQNGSPSAVSAGDLDGDGDADVVCYYADDSRVDWFRNIDGMGTFDSRVIVDVSVNDSDRVVIADLDGDGDLDLICYDGNANDSLNWYENIDGAGTFSGRILIDDDIASTPQDLVIADLDGDGDPDVALALANSDFKWYENIDGAGDFEVRATMDTTVSGLIELSAIDIDHDGDLDLVAAGTNTTDVVWLENLEGAAEFELPRVLGTIDDDPIFLVAADLDANGWSDVLVSTESIPGPIWRFSPRYRGDINGDGVVCFDDVGRMIRALLGTPDDPEDLLRADQDLNGVADARDIHVLVEALLDN